MIIANHTSAKERQKFHEMHYEPRDRHLAHSLIPRFKVPKYPLFSALITLQAQILIQL